MSVAASTPVITGMIFNATNGIDITVSQTSVGTPAISRYYFQYAFNADMTGGGIYNINVTPSAGSSTYSIRPNFLVTDASNIYVKAIAYNGTSGAALTPGTTSGSNFYTSSTVSNLNIPANIINGLNISLEKTSETSYAIKTQLSGYKLTPGTGDMLTQTINGSKYLIPKNASEWIYNAGEKIVQVACGQYHTAVLLSNGTVKTFGSNSDGRLGDGSTIQRTTPVDVSGISTAVAIACGSNHTAVLLANGTVKTFGSNGNGQLGDGSAANSTARTRPVDVSGISTAIAVACGGSHTAVLLSNGTVKTFGSNLAGQLGDGSTSPRTTPVNVSGISTAIAVACGANHTAVLLSNGTVKTFGYNQYGQLGDGTTTDSTTPVDVSGISTAIAVACGSVHTAVLLSNGTVKTFGGNIVGQLGDGTNTPRTTPVDVSGISTAITIACSGFNTAIILSNGTIKITGSNSNGQAGTSTDVGISIRSSYSILNVSDISNAINISCGGDYEIMYPYFHTAVLLADGTLKTFGSNINGQLGNGTSNSSSNPNPGNIVGIQYTPSKPIRNTRLNTETTLMRLGSAITEITTFYAVACLLGHTRIATPAGLRKVEDLVEGDLVLTDDRREVPIRQISKTPLKATSKTAPYKFEAGSIAAGYPAKAFEISPDHAIAAPGGWLIPRYAGLAGVKAEQTRIGEEITYYHLELPNYMRDNLVLEGGTIVESDGGRWLSEQAKPGAGAYVLNKATGLFKRMPVVRSIPRKSAAGGAGSTI